MGPMFEGRGPRCALMGHIDNATSGRSKKALPS